MRNPPKFSAAFRMEEGRGQSVGGIAPEAGGSEEDFERLESGRGRWKRKQ